MMCETFCVAPGGELSGTLRVPGDKSISHRAVMLAALADGTSEIHGFLTGEDCLATLRAFRAMGLQADDARTDVIEVRGAGIDGLRAPLRPLDCGNSGTAMRLMAGILAGQKFESVLVGDDSLSRRPMRRIVEPLTQMGAHIDSSDGGAPLHIHPVQGLKGISYRSPVASAQVKSCLLLAGLYAEGVTEVTEPAASRDHTERMLQSFGVSVESAPGRVALRGGPRLRGCRVDVPADISSAAFFMAGAAIVAGSEVVLKDVGVNPTRTGIIEILRRMGAEIELTNRREFGREPVSDLRVRGGRLRGIEIGRELVTAAIDEFPVIFIAAAAAEGLTVIAGAEELRVKESDRISAMCEGLSALGIEARPLPDGAVIRGGRLQGGTVDSRGDHRVAMSFAIAALRAEQPITILDCDNVNTSFPGFVELAQNTGLRIATGGPGFPLARE